MNKPIKEFVISIMLSVSLCAMTQAAPNSAERLAALSKLPNWSGVWKVTGSSATLSGSKNNPPPYNSESQAKFKAAQQTKSQDTAERFCALAVPRLLGAALPFELIVTPEETLVYYSNREIRHLWTDGRAHPPDDERWPMYWAESKGHWQGPVLVIETINIKGDLWLDATGATLSDNATLQERISKVDNNHLKNEITITDPTAFTRPWTFTRTYQRQPQQELTEQGCQWNAGQAGN